jgi:hypothetical protein
MYTYTATMFYDTKNSINYNSAYLVVTKKIEIVKYQGKQRQLHMSKRKLVYRLPIVQKCYKRTKKRLACIQ